MKDIADLLGRIFISLIFIYEVIDSIVFYDNTKATMTDYGLTWQQDIILIAAISLLVLGATLVLIGYLSRLGATFLLIYYIVFTFYVYSFWNDPEAVKRLNALYFMRNLAVCGGLLILMANGAGKYSVKRLIHVMRLPK